MTACKDRQAKESAVKCLSQGLKRMARVGFEPRPCRSQSRRSNHLTTMPVSLTHCTAIKPIYFTVFIYCIRLNKPILQTQTKSNSENSIFFQFKLELQKNEITIKFNLSFS